MLIRPGSAATLFCANASSVLLTGDAELSKFLALCQWRCHRKNWSPLGLGKSPLRVHPCGELAVYGPLKWRTKALVAA
jgi:hypothetical protein